MTKIERQDQFPPRVASAPHGSAHDQGRHSRCSCLDVLARVFHQALRDVREKLVGLLLLGLGLA